MCPTSGCKQEGQHRRERERISSWRPLKNRDDERRQPNHPDPTSAAVEAFFIARIACHPSPTVRFWQIAARRPRTAAQFFEAKKLSSIPSDPENKLVDSTVTRRRFTRREVYLAKLKHVEQFEDDAITTMTPMI